MRKINCFLFVLVLALGLIHSKGQIDQTITSISPVIEDHIFGQHLKFKSRLMGEKKAVFIYLPNSYKRGSGRYPVCYILAGRSHFEPFTGVVNYLNLYDMISEMIAVALMSSSASIRKSGL